MSDTRLNLTDDAGRALECRRDDALIFRYVYQSDAPDSEAPCPYFHPLRSLGGATLTDYRPEDHPWHHGLSMTLTLVDQHNFWGGPTFVPGEGYSNLSNQGRQQHLAWLDQQVDGNVVRLRQSLAWRIRDGKNLLAETRDISLDFEAADRGWYTLSFAVCLRNTAGRDLELNTYASSGGLTDSPYTGLQLRGQAGFLDPPQAKSIDTSMNDAQVLPDPDCPLIWNGTQSGEAGTHNHRAPWLAIIGQNPSEPPATLIFADDVRNPRFPNTFFCRRSVAQVAFSFVGKTTFDLSHGDELLLRYRIAVGSGVWPKSYIAELAGRLAHPDSASYI